MTENEPEILLVEESKYDVEFMLKALEKYNLTDKVKVFQDGGEVLDYILATGKYSGCDTCRKLRVIILDVKLPKVDGLEVLQRIRASEKYKDDSSSRFFIVNGRPGQDGELQVGSKQLHH